MPLSLKPGERHFLFATFTDDGDIEWYIGQSSLVAPECIYIGETDCDDGDPMRLTRGQVADLLPLLIRFVDTGRIEDPSKYPGD